MAFDNFDFESAKTIHLKIIISLEGGKKGSRNNFSSKEHSPQFLVWGTSKYMFFEYSFLKCFILPDITILHDRATLGHQTNIEFFYIEKKFLLIFIFQV